VRPQSASLSHEEDGKGQGDRRKDDACQASEILQATDWLGINFIWLQRNANKLKSLLKSR
jgi:hypothetical protein